MAIEVTLNTPLADALSNVVQPKLSEVGWSTGGLDDSALGEYIILMLVNGKTQEQIASELSNDLLSLDPEDSGAADFARWLFDQVESLNEQINGVVPQQMPQQIFSAQQHVSPRSIQENQELSIKGASTHMGDAVASHGDGDQAMQDAVDSRIPTGPKSMRNNSKPGNRRMMSQLSKAMDRTGEATLHRIRPQHGTERINTHSRAPPKGPKSDMNRTTRPNVTSREASGPNSGPNGGNQGPLAQMSPQQQMQLLAMLEQQASMMSQIVTPGQFGMVAPQGAFNPAFTGIAGHHQGRSLFDRVEVNPYRQNNQAMQNGLAKQKPYQNSGNKYKASDNSASTLGNEFTSTNGEISSSMEVESSQSDPAQTTCKFNLKCTKQDCPFAHQSPAAPAGSPIDATDTCNFGAACQNKKCVGRHPSPAQKLAYQIEQQCKFFPNCTNPNCTFQHPSSPMCRNGADCTRLGCKFTHSSVKCKFNPCLNQACPYKHVEGQKRGKFGDKTWIPGQETEHVSERKFIDDEMKDEELVIPEPEVKADQGGQENISAGNDDIA